MTANTGSLQALEDLDAEDERSVWDIMFDRMGHQPIDNVNREGIIGLWKWVSQQQDNRLAGRPSEWVQQVWVASGVENYYGTGCGTVCCIAGKTTLDDGHIASVEELKALKLLDEDHQENDPIPSVIIVEGVDVYPREYAQRKLGLTDGQARALFHGANNLESLRKVMSHLVGVKDISVLA